MATNLNVQIYSKLILTSQLLKPLLLKGTILKPCNLSAIAGMSEQYHEVYACWERVLLSIWGLLCTLIGLSGNLLIIFATSKFNPISEIDRCSVIFIKHIAIADVLYIVTRVLPATISHLAGGWVLGSTFCQIEANIYMLPVLASIALVLTFTCFKLFTLIFPLKARVIPRYLPHLMTFSIWFQSSTVPFLSLIFKVDGVVNKEIETICESILNTADKLEYSLGILKNVQLWVPAILNPFCTLALYLVAYKHASIMKRANKNISTNKAVVTVLVVGILFFFTWLPTVVEDSWRQFAPSEKTFPLPLNKAHITLYWITTFMNPIFYVLINRRYREAAKKHISSSNSTGTPKNM